MAKKEFINFTNTEIETVKETVINALNTSALSVETIVRYETLVKEADMTTAEGMNTVIQCYNGTLEQKDKISRSIKKFSKSFKIGKNDKITKEELGASITVARDCGTALQASVMGVAFKVWNNPADGKNYLRPLKEADMQKQTDGTFVHLAERNKSAEKYLNTLNVKQWNIDTFLEDLRVRMTTRLRKALGMN